MLGHRGFLTTVNISILLQAIVYILFSSSFTSTSLEVFPVSGTIAAHYPLLWSGGYADRLLTRKAPVRSRPWWSHFDGGEINSAR